MRSSNFLLQNIKIYRKLWKHGHEGSGDSVRQCGQGSFRFCVAVFYKWTLSCFDQNCKALQKSDQNFYSRSNYMPSTMHMILQTEH